LLHCDLLEVLLVLLLFFTATVVLTRALLFDHLYIDIQQVAEKVESVADKPAAVADKASDKAEAVASKATDKAAAVAEKAVEKVATAPAPAPASAPVAAPAPGLYRLELFTYCVLAKCSDCRV
jgi:hypothetical protein